MNDDYDMVPFQNYGYNEGMRGKFNSLSRTLERYRLLRVLAFHKMPKNSGRRFLQA